MPRPHALFTDEAQELAERRHFNQRPDEHDHLIATLLNLVKRANITSSPPAHQEPTVWSDPVDLTARVTVPAAVGAYATALTFTCPPGRWARINLYGVSVQDAAYTYNGSILWRFRKNGVNIGDGMSDWGEQRGSIINPRPTFILLQEDDVLEFQVRRAVIALAPQDVDHSLQGWTWRLRNNYEGTAAAVTAF